MPAEPQRRVPLWRMLTVMHAAVNASIGPAWARLPTSSARRPSIVSMNAHVVRRAASGRRRRRARRRRGRCRGPPSATAGRWWNAAVTEVPGQRGLELRRPSSLAAGRGRHLAALLHERVHHGDDDLALRAASASGRTVATTASQGVATTTSSAARGHLVRRPRDRRRRAPASSAATAFARASSREPSSHVVARRSPRARRAPVPPVRCHRGCRPAWPTFPQTPALRVRSSVAPWHSSRASDS